MTYGFTLYFEDVHEMTEAIADALFGAGCDDSTPFSRDGEAGAGFDRVAESLESAITTAVADVRSAGLRVKRVTIDPADLPKAGSAGA